MTKDIPITREDIEEIVTILDQTPYDQVDVRIGRFTLKVARTGKGLYIYCALALYRQLPEGVPGAYRLFANLISAAKNPALNSAPAK